MIVGVRQGGLSISETVDLLRFSHTTVSRVCREWREKQKKTSSEQEEKREVTGEGPDWSKLTGR